MMTSWTAQAISLPVRLTYHDRTSEVVRLVYAGCTDEVLLLEDGREIPRSEVHSSGITFSFVDEDLPLAA